MARPDRSALIDEALLAKVSDHPKDLVRVIAQEFGMSRAAVSTRARALIGSGYLARTGSTRPMYAPGPNRRGSAAYQRDSIDEDRVWREAASPLLAGLPANVLDICHHGLTEMVNNAIDHSQGRRVAVWVDRSAERIAMAVADDGIGIFRKIAQALALPDERLALLELSKGKLTTDPRRHSGEGVFFTSRMFDRFQIVSGDLVFDHHDGKEQDLLSDADLPNKPDGTTVLMEIAARSQRTAREVFDRYSSGPGDYAFAKTVVPVRLARIGNENLVSRSQAKRLMQRADRFETVVLDFEGVAMIGQAFADEVFRVFCNDHPQVTVLATHAVPAVQQMIRRAETARAAQED